MNPQKNPEVQPLCYWAAFLKFQDCGADAPNSVRKVILKK